MTNYDIYRLTITLKQNVRVLGSMHPEKFLSRGRGGGLWWQAGLLFKYYNQIQKYIDMSLKRHMGMLYK